MHEIFKILVEKSLQNHQKYVPLYRVRDEVLSHAAHWLLVLVLLIMWLV